NLRGILLRAELLAHRPTRPRKPANSCDSLTAPRNRSTRFSFARFPIPTGTRHEHLQAARAPRGCRRRGVLLLLQRLQVVGEAGRGQIPAKPDDNVRPQGNPRRDQRRGVATAGAAKARVRPLTRPLAYPFLFSTYFFGSGSLMIF